MGHAADTIPIQLATRTVAKPGLLKGTGRCEYWWRAARSAGLALAWNTGAASGCSPSQSGVFESRVRVVGSADADQGMQRRERPASEIFPGVILG
jgi:hypothetical protein